MEYNEYVLSQYDGKNVELIDDSCGKILACEGDTLVYTHYNADKTVETHLRVNNKTVILSESIDECCLDMARKTGYALSTYNMQGEIKYCNIVADS